MTENDKNVKSEKPNTENDRIPEKAETGAPETESGVTIPIKFNKEIKNITADEAARLAQKGMKYDIICKDYEALRNLSLKNGKSVSGYLADLKAEDHNRRLLALTEKCGGDEDLAKHILELESGEEYRDVNGFDELQESFPEIKSPEDLPQEVLDAARLKGTRLLDEYLRYLLEESRRLKESERAKRLNERLSIGSQINRKGQMSAEASEFLKGLWK